MMTYEDEVCKCQNCDREYIHWEEMDPIDDIFERVDPGEPMPSGQCVECGALCQLVSELEPISRQGAEYY